MGKGGNVCVCLCVRGLKRRIEGRHLLLLYIKFYVIQKHGKPVEGTSIVMWWSNRI